MNTIKNAIITAAGLGTRMHPLTADRCKPMIEVDGKPIIGHVLDRLVAAGVTHVGINTHYKPDGLKDYLQDYMAANPGLSIRTLHEDVLLDTGGGIKNLLQVMPDPDQPLFVVSGDSYWEDSAQGSALQLMADGFDPARSDIVLLLKKLADMSPTAGSADYHIDNQGNLTRSPDQTGPYAWTSIRIIKNHSLFDNTPDTPFTFRILMDQAQNAGRLQGRIHDGQWHHFSTPADVAAVNNLISAQKKTLAPAPNPVASPAANPVAGAAITPAKRGPSIEP